MVCGCRMVDMRRRKPPLTLLGMTALLASSGVIHLIRPATFDPIVPKVLPGRARIWTYLSGVAELGVAASLAVPRTRRLGGSLAALLFVAVFPANVKMARDSLRSKRTSDRAKAIVIVRLPLQIPLVVGALGVRRRAS
jgi:uncharacterized membrane protein